MKSILSYREVENFVEDGMVSKTEYLDKINKNYYMYAGDRQKKLKEKDEEWRSNFKSPITRMFVDRVHGMIIGAKKSLTVTDAFGKQRENSEEIVEDIMNRMDYLMNKNETKTALDDVYHDVVKDGVGIAKVGYKYYTKNKPYLDYDDSKEKVLEKKYDYPIVERKSRYNVFMSKYTNAVDNKRFVIERKLQKDSSIRREYAEMPGFTYKQKEVEENYTQMVSAKDYESLNSNIAFLNDIQKADGSEIEDVYSDDMYVLDDKEKKMYREVFEVHGEDYFTIYINGIDHGTYPQVGPNDGYRYKFVRFKGIPGTSIGTGIAKIVEPLQFVYDAIANSRIDNVLLAVHKSFFMQKGMNISGVNKKVRLSPGSVIRVDDMEGFKEIPISDVKESAYKETESMFQLAQAATNVPGMFLGVQNKVERVAGGHNIMSDAFQDQSNSLMRSISHMLSDIAKEFLVLTLCYTDRDEIDRVLGEDNHLKDLELQTIINEYDFSFHIDAKNMKNDPAKLSSLMQLMQIAPKVVDVTGKPAMDVGHIIETYAEGAGLDPDILLENDEVKHMLEEDMEMQQNIKQKQQQGGPQQGGGGGNPQDMKRQMEKAMRQQQTEGGGSPLGDMATNPTGTQQPQQQ